MNIHHTRTRTLLFTALLLTPLATLHTFAAERERPNIVFFLIDDCSTHEFGCYGNKSNPTPNVDRLAESGIRFNAAWATPLCVPTRALLLSGQYGFKTGAYDNTIVAEKRGDLPNKITPLSRTLQQAGYATFMGGYRERYRAVDEAKPGVPGHGYNGVPFAYHEGPRVDATGQFADGTPFRDIREFKAHLLKNESALARNLARHLVIYATGSPVTYSDRAALDTIVKNTAAKHHGVRSLLHAIVQSELFRNK